jgi:hypothetical protein
MADYQYQSTRYPVFFRVEDLTEAYDFAARLEERAEDRHTAVTVSPDETYVFGTWTRDDIERAYRESPTGMRLLFDGMAARPDEDLTADDLAGFLTHKPHADAIVVRGTMGAFANRCGLRYQRNKRDFPFRHWYLDGGFARYRMPRAVADVINSMRGNESDGS